MGHPKKCIGLDLPIVTSARASSGFARKGDADAVLGDTCFRAVAVITTPSPMPIPRAMQKVLERQAASSSVG